MKGKNLFLSIVLILVFFTSCADHTPVPAPQTNIEASPTPFLEPLPITAANISQLTEVLSFGRGSIRNLLWGSEDEFYFVTSSGIEKYDQLGDILLYRIEISDYINTAILSKDGERLIGCTETSVYIWDASNGNQLYIYEIANTESRYYEIKISPNGDQIFLNSQKTVLVLSDTLKLIKIFNSETENSFFWKVAISPDGQTLALATSYSTKNELIEFYDTQTWSKNNSFDFSRRDDDLDLICSLEFSPDGRSLFIDYCYFSDQTLIVDAQSGSHLEKVEKHYRSSGVALSSDWKYTVESYSNDNQTDNYIDIFDRESKQLKITLHDPNEPVYHFDYLVFSPDNNYMLTGTSFQDGIRLWEIETGIVLKKFTGYLADLTSIDVSPDGRTVAFANYDGTIKMLDMNNGQIINELKPDVNLYIPLIYELTYSPDGSLLSSNAQGATFVLNSETLETIFDTRQSTSGDCESSSIITPDNRSLIVSCNGLHVFKTEDWQEILTFDFSKEEMKTLLAISPESRYLVYVAQDGLSPAVWDMEQNITAYKISGWRDVWTKAARFSPDNKWLIIGNDQKLCSYSVEQDFKEIDCNQDGTSTEIEFNSSSELLLTGRAYYQLDNGYLLKIGNPEKRRTPWLSDDNLKLFTRNTNGTYSVWQVLGTAEPTQQTIMPPVEPTEMLLSEPTATVEPTLTEVELSTDYEIRTILSPIDGKTMVYVPQGDFIMGAEDYDDNPLESRIVSAFWIDQTEVTNGEYARFLNDVGNLTEDGSLWYGSEYYDEIISHNTGTYVPASGYEKYPVTLVTWYGANAYCQWAGKRLPTQVEWEKAARGIDGRIYAWGNEAKCGDANLDDQPKTNPEDSLAFDQENCDGYVEAAPVMSFSKDVSPYGAYDMTGNVSEWVQDWTDHKIDDPKTGYNKMIKGGGFSSGWYYGSILFWGSWPEWTNPSVGFRCAISN